MWGGGGCCGGAAAVPLAAVGLRAAVTVARLAGVMARQLDQGGMIIAATHVPLGREPDCRLELGGTP